ncbi:MAG: DUF255 domain-containing protein [Bacteroidia bacterium]|nr:DUF255 domain-containing protein [Bacteroidia bacterium]
MKFRLILGLIAFLSLSSFQEKGTLKWYEWNEAYPLAQKTGKILLVDAYTDWCGWCKKMDRDTYSNPEIIALLNKDFIVVKFNPELEGRVYKIDSLSFGPREFYAQLHRGESTGFPTTYFINPGKRNIFMDPGYRDPATFKQVLEYVLKEYK